MKIIRIIRLSFNDSLGREIELEPETKHLMIQIYIVTYRHKYDETGSNLQTPRTNTLIIILPPTTRTFTLSDLHYPKFSEHDTPVTRNNVNDNVNVTRN